MINESNRSYLTYLGEACRGSLVGLLLMQRHGQHLPELTPDTMAKVIDETEAQLHDLGINALQVAESMVFAQCCLYAQGPLSERLQTSIATVLWETLGDPKSGPPPQLYRHAAARIHALLCLCLDPGIAD